MRTIIAGSREVSEELARKLVRAALKASGFNVTEVIHGNARGIDRASECLNLPTKVFPADWETYGKSAGYRRNVVMAENADALIAIWDGVSKGTKNMIDIAKSKGLKVYVHGFSVQSK